MPSTSDLPIETKVKFYERKSEEAQITALALTIISLVLLTLALVLYGVAHLSPETTMGLAFLPYIGGVFLGAIGVGVFMGALVHFAIAAVRQCQK